MADGLDFDSLEKAQGPQDPGSASGTGLDFSTLEGNTQAQTPPQAVSPTAGLDFETLSPNPNLDIADQMTPKIYAQNVWKTFASGVEPVSRYFVNMGKGALRSTGSGLAGLGNVAEDFLPGTMPFMPYSPSSFSELKSMGSKLAKLGELKRDENGNWFNEDLASGIGGTAPYMGAGILGGAAAATGLGMLDMGQSMYDEAKAAGASETDANLSFLAGSAIGATEAIPVGYMLRKINQLSGGNFYEVAKRLGSAGAVKEAVKGFLLEGGTEAAQQVAQNWVASDLVGYDPTRTLSENAWDSFITGGAVGSLMMGSLGALQKSARNDARMQLEKARTAALASGDPINAIAGEFTPTREVLPLREQANQVTGELTEEGKTAAPPVSEKFVSPERQASQPQVATPEFYQKIFGPLDIDTRVERAILKIDENSLTVDEALKRTPVVTMKLDPYREQISMVEKLLAQPEPPDGWGLTHELMRKKLEALKKKTDLTKIFAGHMKDYVGKFMDVLGDGTKVLLGDMTGRTEIYAGVKPPRHGGTINGLMTIIPTSRVVDGKQENVLIIEMDFDKLATMRYEEELARKPWYSTEGTRAARQSFFETVNHELGHYFVYNRVNGLLTEGAASGSASNENTLIHQAIMNDYQKWLARMKKSQFAEYLENTGTPQYQPKHADEGTYTIDMDSKDRNYLFSFDEYHAQQMARLATQGKLAGEKILTKYFTPALKQYQAIFDKLPHFAKQEYGNFEKFIKRQSLHHQISEEIEKAIAGGPKTFYDALKGLPGFNPENFAGLADELDNWNAVKDYGYNLLQIQRANPHIEGLRSYVDFTRAWAAYSRSIDARATETLASWRKLGRKKIQAVNDVLLEESANKKRLDGAELLKRLPELDQQEVYAQIRQDFSFVLKEMEQISIDLVKKNFPDNPELQNTQIAEIQSEFAKMDSQGYFPFMRFGKWTVTARNAKGDIVAYEAFDTKRERDVALRTMQAKDPSNKYSASVMKDSQFIVQGLPAAMLRTMRDKIPNLSDEQRTAIDDALKTLAPFSGLKNQFLRRKGTWGYSLDAMRSYANYMRMSAGHLSRVKYGEDLMLSIGKVDGDAKTLSLLGRDATKRQQISNWMKGHNDYIMDPTSEWTGLRGAVFQWFLGFNIKSAVVNLSQVPMVTYPYLAARYGDMSAVRELATANASAVSYWKNRKKWIDAAPDSQRGRIVQLLEQGKKDGWLDQSLAMELAVASSEGNIQRTVMQGTKRAYYKMSEWGAKPFAVAEKLNRTVAAIATYNLEYARSKSHTTAYNAARDAVDRTQYENSRWNRPRFQRGKMGSAFVFTNYIQNTLHFMMGGDAGATRAMMMLFLAAGLMGLPGAENAEDLIDWGATKTRELLGVKDPKFDLRAELREFFEELHMNPDLLLHGAGRETFGLGALGEMTGLPLPELDLSGSLSMGDIVPGAGLLGGSTPANSAEGIGRLATEAGGAGAAAFNSFLQGIWSKDPDQWKRAEKMMPVWMKNVSQGSRLLTRGKETSAAGDVVAEFDPQDPKELIEGMSKMLGFQPTSLTNGWERVIAEREAVNYYRMRQEGLLKAHNWAFVQEDEDAVRDVRQKIKEYNEQVPWPELGIGTKSIQSSLRTYIESRAKNEMGIAAQQKYIRLRQSVAAVYTPQDTGGSGQPSPPAQP